jgi:hypothetical protein
MSDEKQQPFEQMRLLITYNSSLITIAYTRSC